MTGSPGRLVHDGLAGRLGQLRVGPEQRGFLGREVVEEGPGRDVGRLCDLFHGDVRVAALGDHPERLPAEFAAGRQLLALAEGGGRRRAVRRGLEGLAGLAGYSHHALTKGLRGLQVCVQLNLTVCATLPRRGVIPGPAPTMLAVPASPVSPALAAEIARRHYGVVAAAERLASEFDDTFRLVGGDGSGRLLKISADAPGARAVGGSAGRTGWDCRRRCCCTWPRSRRRCRCSGWSPRWTGGRRSRSGSMRGGRAPAGADDVVAGRAAARRGTVERAGCAGTSAPPWPGSTSPCAGSAHPGAGRTHRWDLQQLRRRCGRCWPSCPRATGGARARRTAWTGSTRWSRPRLAGVATAGHPHRFPRGEPARPTGRGSPASSTSATR